MSRVAEVSEVSEVVAAGAQRRASQAEAQVAFAKVRGAVAHKLRKGAWALGDQALISATNFATMLLVAWGLSKQQFGAFTLVYAALLQANTLQGALITQPHNVLGASRTGEVYARYTTSTAAAAAVIALCGAALAGAAAGIAALIGWGGVAPLLLALAPAVVGWQAQEFVRRVFYTERRFADAFVNDLIGYGGYAAAVAVLYYLRLLTAPLALYALAGTSLLGAAVGAWRLRDRWTWPLDRGAARENWDFGKWLAGGAMLRWFSTAQMFQFLAAILLGTAATATLKSAQIVLGPTRMLATSLTTVLPTHFSRRHAAGGKAGLHRELKSTYLLVTPVLAAYCLAVAVFAEPLLRLLYPDDKYADGATVLRLYALSSFLSYNLHFAGSALRAGRLTRDVFRISLYVGIVAVALGWVFIETFGVSGALIAMVATAAVSNVLYWLAYRRHLAEDDTQEQSGREPGAATAAGAVGPAAAMAAGE